MNLETTGDQATPLFIAAQCGHEKVVQILLAKGAKVDHRDMVFSFFSFFK